MHPFVQLSLELASTEDEIYELSLAREPKDGKETSSISVFYFLYNK